MGEYVVVAIGGNALQQPDDAGGQRQSERVTTLCQQLAGMVADGHRVALIHGNGPQVGSLLFRSWLSRGLMEPLPLDVEVAHTQGQLGYLIAQALQNEFSRLGRSEPVVSVVTRVVVSEGDPNWHNPTKPVGPPVDTLMMQRIGPFNGGLWIPTRDNRWQLTVPSPEPVEILESLTIRHLLESGAVVVACGGGGIPVLRSADGSHRGVQAVIDKDLTAQRLATSVGADILLTLISVDGVILGFNTLEARLLKEVRASEMKRHHRAGEFPPGSMGPKVEAAIRFVAAGGSAAVIGPIERAQECLRGDAGTWILPDQR